MAYTWSDPDLNALSDHSEASIKDNFNRIMADINARQAAQQSKDNTTAIVNAINSASAQSTVVAPYQPIPVKP